MQVGSRTMPAQHSPTTRRSLIKALTYRVVIVCFDFPGDLSLHAQGRGRLWVHDREQPLHDRGVLPARADVGAHPVGDGAERRVSEAGSSRATTAKFLGLTLIGNKTPTSTSNPRPSRYAPRSSTTYTSSTRASSARGTDKRRALACSTRAHAAASSITARDGTGRPRSSNARATSSSRLRCAVRRLRPSISAPRRSGRRSDRSR